MLPIVLKDLGNAFTRLMVSQTASLGTGVCAGGVFNADFCILYYVL